MIVIFLVCIFLTLVSNEQNIQKIKDRVEQEFGFADKQQGMQKNQHT